MKTNFSIGGSSVFLTVSDYAALPNRYWKPYFLTNFFEETYNNTQLRLDNLVTIYRYFSPTKILSFNLPLFRLERLGHGGLAKIIGTLVSVVGALIVTFYAGPAIITSHLSSITPRLLLQSPSNDILGGVLLLITSVIGAFSIILQVHYCYLHKYTYIQKWIHLLTYDSTNIYRHWSLRNTQQCWFWCWLTAPLQPFYLF